MIPSLLLILSWVGAPPPKILAPPPKNWALVPVAPFVFVLTWKGELVMSLGNLALLDAIGLLGVNTDDNRTAGGATGVTTQAGASSIVGQCTRFTVGGTNFSCVLKPVLSGDGAPMCWIVNDTAAAINTYPAPGEFNNGTQNLAISIPAGQSLFCVRVPNKLGGASAGWRTTVVL